MSNPELDTIVESLVHQRAHAIATRQPSQAARILRALESIQQWQPE